MTAPAINPHAVNGPSWRELRLRLDGHYVEVITDDAEVVTGEVDAAIWERDGLTVLTVIGRDGQRKTVAMDSITAIVCGVPA